MNGCEIEVKMSIPLFQKEWKIGNAFHKSECKAISNFFIRVYY